MKMVTPDCEAIFARDKLSVSARYRIPVGETFDTTNVSPSHRISAWSDIVCDVDTHLDCRSDLGSDFYGSITTAGLGSAVSSAWVEPGG